MNSLFIATGKSLLMAQDVDGDDVDRAVIIAGWIVIYAFSDLTDPLLQSSA